MKQRKRSRGQALITLFQNFQFDYIVTSAMFFALFARKSLAHSQIEKTRCNTCSNQHSERCGLNWATDEIGDLDETDIGNPEKINSFHLALGDQKEISCHA